MSPRVPSTSCRSVTKLRSALDVVALQKRWTFDHHEDVVFVRREPTCDLLELLEFGRVGAEQLAERVVDVDARKPNAGQHRQDNDQAASDQRNAQSPQPHAFQAEGDIDGLCLVIGRDTIGVVQCIVS